MGMYGGDTMITQEKLLKLFDYNLDTGVFTYKTNTRNKNKGDIVGAIGSHGYLTVAIKRKHYLLHRLAFLYVTGSFPDTVDHINHNKLDNRWINLRDVKSQDNAKNRSLSDMNTSGCIGVSWNKGSKRWRAKIQVDGKQVHLGYFSEFSEAVNARKNAEVLYGYHKNHGGKNHE